MDERLRWEQAADDLYAPPHFAPDAVSYGPWAAGESELQLLGPMTGLDVVDLGCGGGENAVALAQAGAAVTGIDISGRALARGARLATQFGVEVAWRCGDMHAAATWDGLRCDLILATYVLPYSQDVPGLLARCMAALKPGGRLVASFDHPLRACFWDAEDGETVTYPVRDYHADAPLHWQINAAQVEYRPRTTGFWVDALLAAGLTLARLVEPPPPPALVAEYWPEDSGAAPLAHIPHTLILVAQHEHQYEQRASLSDT